MIFPELFIICYIVISSLLFFRKMFITFTIILMLFFFFFFSKILISFSGIFYSSERLWNLSRASFRSFSLFFDNIYLSFLYVEKEIHQKYFIVWKLTLLYELSKLYKLYEHFMNCSKSALCIIIFIFYYSILTFLH